MDNLISFPFHYVFYFVKGTHTPCLVHSAPLEAAVLLYTLQVATAGRPALVSLVRAYQPFPFTCTHFVEGNP